MDIEERKTLVNREQLLEILHGENILARRYFPGCHLMEPYRSCFPHAGLSLPETERLSQRVLCLPTGTAVEPEQFSLICEIIRPVASLGVESRERISNRYIDFVPVHNSRSCSPRR